MSAAISPASLELRDALHHAVQAVDEGVEPTGEVADLVTAVDLEPAREVALAFGHALEALGDALDRPHDGPRAVPGQREDHRQAEREDAAEGGRHAHDAAPHLLLGGQETDGTDLAALVADRENLLEVVAPGPATRPQLEQSRWFESRGRLMGKGARGPRNMILTFPDMDLIINIVRERPIHRVCTPGWN
jgi:hypothetical protein